MQAGGRRFDPVRLHHVRLHPLSRRRVGCSPARVCAGLSGDGSGLAGAGPCIARGFAGAACACVCVRGCSLLIVNQVLVRLWARRASRAALGWRVLCMSAWVVWGCPWLCWHGCLTRAAALRNAAAGADAAAGFRGVLCVLSCMTIACAFAHASRLIENGMLACFVLGLFCVLGLGVDGSCAWWVGLAACGWALGSSLDGSGFGARAAALACEHEKGIWWMPWRQEAMKDVARCEKPGGAASRL